MSIPIQEMRAYLAGFDAGLASGSIQGQCDGFTAGFKQAESELRISLTAQIDKQLRDAQTVTDRALVEQVIRQGRFSDRADRRGQPERAARHRALIAGRGIK